MAHKILLNGTLLRQNFIYDGLWLDLVATPMPRSATTLNGQEHAVVPTPLKLDIEVAIATMLSSSLPLYLVENFQ
jgi:hypothetical protein